MGGIGVGTVGFSTINPVNPASFASLRLTTLDITGFGEFRSQKGNGNTNSLFNGGFHNFGLGFKTNKPLSIVLGLRPISSVGYNISLPDTITLDTTSQPHTVNYSGSGGLNQFYLGFGFSLFRKLRIGASLPITFGTINYRWETEFEDVSVRPVTIRERTTLIGVTPTFGVQYEDSLKFRKKVDELEVLKDRRDKIADLFEELDKRDQDYQKEKAETDALRKDYEAKMAENNAEKDKITKQRENLEGAGTVVEKEVEKLRKLEFKYVTKNKRLEQKLRKEEKELKLTRQRIDRERKVLNEELSQIAEKEQKFKDGTNDSLRFRTEEKKLLYRLGGVITTSASLTGDRSLVYDVIDFTDTVISNTDGKVGVPTKIGLGFTVGQSRKWSAGMDIMMQDWGDLDYFGSPDPSLGRSIKVSLGAEWIPSYFSRKGAERIAWRAGAYFQETPYRLNNQAVTEFGVTVGMGIPLGFRPERSSLLFSRLNLGLMVGKRGTVDNSLLRENIVQLRIGMNLNDRWFIRRRID